MSGASLASIKPLSNREGYKEWQFKMKMYLIHEDLWFAVVGFPDDEIPEATRELIDLKAMSKMCLTLEGEAISHVTNCTTAEEVWLTLAKAYEDRGFGARLAIERRLYRYHLSNFDSMKDYILAILETIQDLSDKGKKIDDATICAILLGGLTTEFDPLVHMLENSDRELSSDYIKAKLLTYS